MAARTGKRSILTILRNNREMWTVYQTIVICVWIIMAGYDLCNKFADNKNVAAFVQKMLNNTSCSETAMLKSEMVGHSIDLCSEWREKISVPFNKFQQIRRLLSDKKRCRKSGKKGKGCKRRENTQPVHCKARETCNRVSAGIFLNWQMLQQSEKQTNNLCCCLTTIRDTQGLFL